MQSGRLTLVRQEMANTSSPRCRAAMTSVTVDMPTASAPKSRSMRVSAGVSRLGPTTPA